MSLTTRAVIKSDWFNITSMDTTSDKLIDRLIAVVDAEIPSLCDQPIEAVAKTFYIAGNGKRYLTLPYSVPVTLTSVGERYAPDEAFTDITSESTLDELSTMRRLYRQNGWLQGYTYRIVATVGYAVVPADITVCANEMVTELYNETPFAANGSTFGVASISEIAGGHTLTKALQSMRPKVLARLQPYRRVTI
jgi:hypothetical protein